MLRSKDEHDAHEELLGAMETEGLTEYSYGGVTVKVENHRKCKVKVEGKDDPEG